MLNTLLNCLAIPFRKEPKQTIKRVRNSNGQYSRFVRVNYYGKQVGGFYMESKKNFRATGRG